ncbi:unnamed protein product, partial [Nesidiocoris tenuis]
MSLSPVTGGKADDGSASGAVLASHWRTANLTRAFGVCVGSTRKRRAQPRTASGPNTSRTVSNVRIILACNRARKIRYVRG